MNELLNLEPDQDLLKELLKNSDTLKNKLDDLEIQTLFSGKYDANNAIITSQIVGFVRASSSVGLFKLSGVIRKYANEAVRLAEKYGADVEKAKIAGILHDITKETPPIIKQDFGRDVIV